MNSIRWVRYRGHMQIAAIESGPDLAAIRELFQQYWRQFGFSPCFQNFDAELAGLPGDYAAPHGRLALATVDDKAAGCVALRRFDAERCEAKRLYVRPEFRGQGIGRALLEWVIAEARLLGYREMLGDTIDAMDRALAMYDRMGFERTGPYSADPTPHAIYLRYRL